MSDRPTPTPESVIERFGELLAAGDVEALLELYEPDATLAPQSGESVTGTAAIREALAPFAAARPRMTADIHMVLLAGDTALLSNRWTLAGTGPDGEPLEMAGVSADVLRRRPSGSWGIVIDNPWGAGR
jgi:uncharacterized protein (TIGR02246 family)